MGSDQSRRLAGGGLIDRSCPVRFTLDGAPWSGYAGDTVASSLVAGGLLRVADSIYRRRPRGVLSAGVEEPNAFVMVRGEHDESMLPATTLELTEGMELRLLDGIGTLDQRPDPAEYDKKHVHADVAVIGSGPAGLAAAREAASGGARVVLFEQDFVLGGDLAADPTQTVEGLEATEWVAEVRAELEAAAEVTVLVRTTVVGSYDGNYLVALEKRPEGEPAGSGGSRRLGVSRQRLWHVTAGQLVLATGAYERPVVFAGNDTPGVMLASAVRAYLRRYAALPGEDAVVFTTNDSGYETAAALRETGARVRVVDAREGSAGATARERAGLTEADVRTGSAVVGVDGGTGVASVWVAPLDADGTARTSEAERVPCDLVAVSGGWTPAVHLHSQRQGSVRWDDDLAGFVPVRPVPDQHVAGAVNGTYWTEGCRAEGVRAGRLAAEAAGYPSTRPQAIDGAGVPHTWRAEQRAHAGVTRPLWLVAGLEEGYDTHFVDLQRDSTVADVARATGAGMRSVEHVKRYTSIGTGVDQGKTSGVATMGC